MTKSFDFSRARRVILLSSALTATSLPAVASAQGSLAEDAAPEGEIVVTAANRTETELDKIGQTVSVIDLAEIERRQTQNIADILRTVPGVGISRSGSIGGTTSVFIRGAESDQTVALIDGVKLNDPSSPGVAE